MKDYSNMTHEDFAKESQKQEELEKLISGKKSLLKKIGDFKKTDNATVKVADSVLELTEKEMQVLVNYWLSFIEKYDKRIQACLSEKED